MIRLCIFDLDGTLIDSAPDIMDSANYALSQYGLPLRNLTEIKDGVGNGLANLFKRFIPENRYESVAEKVKADFTGHYAAHCTEKTMVYPGMQEVLAEISNTGILLAINTNKPQIFLEKIVRDLFSDIAFSRVMGAGEFPRKPDPSGVNAMLGEFNIAKAECVYIGDSDVDIKTAANAGVHDIGVTWGYRDRKVIAHAGAKYIIDQPKEIITALKRLTNNCEQ